MGLIGLMGLMSCEKALDPSLSKANQDGNVEVDCWFEGSADKLCVMAFTPDGSRALSKVKTGAAGVPVVLDLPVGDYVLVAVAHSSASTPSLKSPQQVVFNAKDGRKLTDTWCKTTAYTVEHDQPVHTEMTLTHATACVRFLFDDDVLPDGTTALRFDYSGGSANVNPSTLEGCTKSNQSELRTLSDDGVYTIYTFPYMSADGVLKITVCCLDAQGAVLYSRTISNVPVSRGQVTTVEGSLVPSDTGLGFKVNSEWDGETTIDF